MTGTRSWQKYRAPFFFLVFGIIAYSNSFHCPFIFDGRQMIENDPRIRHLWPLTDLLYGSSRPFARLSFAVNYALFKFNVFGYHLVNLLIHLLAALTLFGLVRRTLESPRLRAAYRGSSISIAFAAAALWLLHPVATECVTYIYQRAESLMALFYLFTLYALARSFGASDGQSKWRLAACVSCALGMASKAVMITAPLMVLAYDRIFWAASWKEIGRRRLFYAGLALTWLVILAIALGPYESRKTIGYGLKSLTPLRYAAVQPQAILHYLRISLLPNRLVLDYGWPQFQGAAGIFLPFIAVLVLLAGTVWALARRPAIGFLGLWFFLILLPTSSFFPIADPVVEHRLYLPLAAVILCGVLAVRFLLVRILARGRLYRVFRIACFAAASFVLCVATFQRNVDYRSRYAVWKDVVAKRPANLRAHINFANVLVKRKEYEKAIKHYRIALEGSTKTGKVLTRVSFAECHYNFAVALAEEGDLDGAASHYRQALRFKPDFVDAYNNYAMVLSQKKQYEEAIAQLTKAIRLDDDNADLRVNLGTIYDALGLSDDAIDQYWSAVYYEPDNAEAQNDLGVALAKKGWTRVALMHLRKARALAPDDDEIKSNFAEAARAVSGR